MIILGLTGSIGMGKTTVTDQFADAGAATTNADAIVHDLLQNDTKVIAAVQEAFPGVVEDNTVNRRALGDAVFGDDARMKTLEAILHPRVRAVEVAFILRKQKEGERLVVLDIPLLYETGADARCDKVVVVTTTAEIQRQRVMGRDGMTEEKFHAILARQLPDEEKRHRADYVIDTGKGLEHSAAQVRAIMDELHKQEGHRHA